VGLAGNAGAIPDLVVKRVDHRYTELGGGGNALVRGKRLWLDKRLHIGLAQALALLYRLAEPDAHGGGVALGQRLTACLWQPARVTHGGGIVLGQLNEWQPGECDPATQDCSGFDTSVNNNTDVGCGTAGSDGSAAYFRRDNCANDGAIEIPPVVPYLDINIGPRFNISDRASIRLEGGVHAFLPYGGGSVGIVF